MSDITNQILYSGDTINWEETIDDYPVSTHTVKYLLQRTNEAPTETTHQVSGISHKFILAVPSTGGTYKFQKKAVLISDSSEQTIDTGYVNIEASLAEGTDLRSDNKIILDALIAVQKGYATREQIKIEVSGRAIEYYSPLEREKLIDIYEGKVERENRLANEQAGTPQILDQFGAIS